jgi:hypothetical protein
MLGNAYDLLAAALWEYLDQDGPADNEVRDQVHADTMHYLDERLRAAGVEVY